MSLAILDMTRAQFFTAEEMAGVEESALAAVTERVTQIARGEASPRPVKDGMESPCAWCDHAEACRFDSTVPGCRIAEIDHRLLPESTRISGLPPSGQKTD